MNTKTFTKMYFLCRRVISPPITQKSHPKSHPKSFPSSLSRSPSRHNYKNQSHPSPSLMQWYPPTTRHSLQASPSPGDISPSHPLSHPLTTTAPPILFSVMKYMTQHHPHTAISPYIVFIMSHSPTIHRPYHYIATIAPFFSPLWTISRIVGRRR